MLSGRGLCTPLIVCINLNLLVRASQQSKRSEVLKLTHHDPSIQHASFRRYSGDGRRICGSLIAFGFHFLHSPLLHHLFPATPHARFPTNSSTRWAIIFMQGTRHQEKTLPLACSSRWLQGSGGSSSPELLAGTGLGHSSHWTPLGQIDESDRP